MKCRWKHCKFGGEVDKDKAVKVGIAYFHPECYAERESIQKIIDVWHEKVDAYPMESMLRKMVNDLVLKQNVNAEFLLFALNYCLDNGWNLRHPAGLKAVSKDDKAHKAWDKIQNKKLLGNNTSTVIIDEFRMDDIPFDFKPQKAVGFEDILR